MRKRTPGIALALLILVVSATSAYGQEFSPWSEAVPVAGSINTPNWNEYNPFTAKNNLDLYFASNNPSLESRRPIGDSGVPAEGVRSAPASVGNCDAELCEAPQAGQNLAPVSTPSPHFEQKGMGR